MRAMPNLTQPKNAIRFIYLHSSTTVFVHFALFDLCVRSRPLQFSAKQLEQYMLFEYLTSALVTLLVVIDPPGLGPIFLGLSGNLSDAQRRSAAVRAAVIATAVLIFFAFLGAKLLHLVGIGIPAFRIAGGLLLFSIAFEMLFDLRSQRKGDTAQKAVVTDHFQDIAAFPLAIPLMAGPGAITAVILLAARADGSLTHLAGLVAIIMVVILASYLVFLAAGPISKALGVTGNIVLTRLLGMLLAALAVQFIIDGVMALK